MQRVARVARSVNARPDMFHLGLSIRRSRKPGAGKKWRYGCKGIFTAKVAASFDGITATPHCTDAECRKDDSGPWMEISYQVYHHCLSLQSVSETCFSEHVCGGLGHF